MSLIQPDPLSHDFYKVLGVAKDATDSDVSRAYKRLALKHHPDKNPHNKEQAEEAFKNISEAYRTLGDPKKRLAYDQFGKEGPCEGSSPGFAPGGGSFSFVFMPDAPTGHIPFDFGFSDMIFGGHRVSSTRHRALSQAVPVGTLVVVRGLKNSMEHNGKTGKIVRFDDGRGRYDVEVAPDTTVAVRPQNITQKCSLEVIGFESKPELNGKIGDIFNYDEETGSYIVVIQQPPLLIALQRGNCLLKKGTRVILQGLKNAKFNGQMAQIMVVDRAAERYEVLCQNGDQIRINFDKVVC